eukprot:m.265592 g.265592  ORF g.265592 m.265592 type:complete len:313 (+) comp40489_c0_seq1:704-1642(+)
MFPDNKLKRKILSISVICRLHQDGCLWFGELREIKGHLEQCSFVKEECVQGCGQIIRRSEKVVHYCCNCPKRIVNCTYCETSMPQDELQEHYSSCIEKPIPCLFCTEEFQRGKMVKHTFADCPKVTIQCSYAEFGCKFRCERALLDDHLKNAAVDHNKQLLEEFKGIFKIQREEISNLRKSLLSIETYLGWNEEPGSFMWALKTEPEEQLSANYYTNRPGYKIRFYSKMVSGKLRIYVQLMEGEYDNAIVWPANFECSACALTDQKREESIIKNISFTIEKTWDSILLFLVNLPHQYVRNGILLLNIRVEEV